MPLDVSLEPKSLQRLRDVRLASYPGSPESPDTTLWSSVYRGLWWTNDDASDSAFRSWFRGSCRELLQLLALEGGLTVGREGVIFGRWK